MCFLALLLISAPVLAGLTITTMVFVVLGRVILSCQFCKCYVIFAGRDACYVGPVDRRCMPLL